MDVPARETKHLQSVIQNHSPCPIDTARSPMEGWIRSDSLPHLYKLDRKIQALSRSVSEVQAELSLAKVDQQRLCAQLRAQGGNSMGKNVFSVDLKNCLRYTALIL